VVTVGAKVVNTSEATLGVADLLSDATTAGINVVSVSEVVVGVTA